jgi:hypothetical protein
VPKACQVLWFSDVERGNTVVEIVFLLNAGLESDLWAELFHILPAFKLPQFVLVL